MLRRIALAAAMAMAPLAAGAEEPAVLAQYWTNNGSLPPEYAWEASITIHADGKLELKRCKGYETTGPACKTRRATVSDADLQAIGDAARASGLLEDPALETPEIMIGGGLTGGVVYLDGQKISLLSQPIAEDAERVASVLRAIRAAVPDRLTRLLEED
jgi:hypothetical protein